MYGAFANEKMTCGLQVKHVNIVLYYFTPITNTFNGIGPGETIRCLYHNLRWTVAKSDHMPNWFVVAPGLEAKLLKSTAGESIDFVGNFDTPAKWKRTVDDTYNPFTTEHRYDVHKRGPSEARPYRTIPTPKTMTLVGDASLDFDKSTWIVKESADFGFETKFLSGKNTIKRKIALISQ